LLRCLQVPGLEILPQLGECLHCRAGPWGGVVLSYGREILRQCGEIGLRLLQISRLQILPQLLKLSLDLLKRGRCILRSLRILSRAGKQIAAKDANDGHFSPLHKI
jgi:hypothetical protein